MSGAALREARRGVAPRAAGDAHHLAAAPRVCPDAPEAETSDLARDLEAAALAWASPERRRRVDPQALVAALRAVGGPRATIRLRSAPALSHGRGAGVEARVDRERGVDLHLAADTLPLLLGPTTPLPLALAEAAIGDERPAERLRDLLDALQAPLLGALQAAHETFAPTPGGADATRWEDALLALADLDAPDADLPRPLRLRLLPRLLTAPPSASTLAWAIVQVVDELVAETEADAAPGDERAQGGRGRARRGRGGAPRARPRPSPAALQVDVETPCATTVAIDPRDRPRLGAPTARLGERALLGARARLGEGLRIHLRGLALPALIALRPGTIGLRRIAALIERLAPPRTRWELALHVDAPPSLRLGAGVPLGLARLDRRGARPWPASVVYPGAPRAQETMKEATP